MKVDKIEKDKCVKKRLRSCEERKREQMREIEKKCDKR